MIFSPPARNKGHPKPEAASSAPASVGLAAAARLRGTEVTLAAAARSSAATTAMTYEVRVGTSIWESALRTSNSVIASGRLGANGTSARQRFAGRCVNTMVLMRPILSAIQAAAK